MTIVFLRDIINDHKSFGKQIFVLAKTELRRTYQGAAIGPLWAVVKPAFQLFVYYFAFEIGLKVSKGIKVLIHGDWIRFDRFAFMLVGLVPWFFIQESIVKGAKDIRSHRQYVTKINFPVSTIMTFSNLSRLYVHFFLSGIMVLYVAFDPKLGLSWYNLQYFFYMPLMFLFFLFLSWSTAPMCAFSPDLENGIVSLMAGMFWLTGVIYNSYNLPNESLNFIMLFNPINFFVNGYKNAFLYHRMFFEYKTELFIFLAEFLVVFIIGVFNYNRLRKRIPDVL